MNNINDNEISYEKMKFFYFAVAILVYRLALQSYELVGWVQLPYIALCFRDILKLHSLFLS